jgi:two-component system, OmpR family, response regulator
MNADSTSEATARSEAEAGENAATQPCLGAQVLLVEDESALRELLAQFLEVRGYRVHAVSNGRLAARWLAAHSVDVVLTDLCMPDADGVELLMELRQRPVRTSVIAMSGGINGDAESLLHMATLLGAKRTLQKPFALEELARVVREVVGR